MLILIVTVIIVIIIWYYYQNQEMFGMCQETFETFVNINTNKDKLLVELIQDRNNYFEFKKSHFVYLDKFKKEVENIIKKLNKEKNEMEKFIKDYQDNVKLMEQINAKKELLKPLYTQHDLNENRDKMKEIKKTYNRHIKQFLELFQLNNQLLVKQLYCQDKNLSCQEDNLDLMANYNKIKSNFNVTLE